MAARHCRTGRRRASRPLAHLPAGLLTAFLLTATIFLTTILPTTPAGAQDFRAGYNAYLRGDYAGAFREWEPLAHKGYKQAQTNLGTLYSHAKGVDRNYPLAAFW